MTGPTPAAAGSRPTVGGSEQPGGALSPWAVYVHVPFCLRRCHYCDFATQAVPEGARTRLFQTWRRAVGRELATAPPRPASTIYFGGGTPTVLGARLLLEVLEAVADRHPLAHDAEITVEANPTTAEANLFRDLRAGGVNRLSLGVQSLDDARLAWLGRTHDTAQAVAAFDTARRAGFDNVSIDLMFGLAGQRPEDWERELARAVALGPEHLSVYGLTVEPGTPLAGWVATGRVRLPGEGLQARMFELARERLAAAGYEHYEISNYARAGCRSRHNQTYWRNEEYRGYGPAAASYVARVRWTNTESLAQYAARLAADESPVAERDPRDERGERRDTMFLGLRLLEGVDRDDYARRFGAPPEAFFAAELDHLSARGLVETDGRRWRLTAPGLLLANQALMEFA